MKKREWKQAERSWLLAVEDPQQLGRDIGSGTYNIRNVQHLFAAAAATLRDCMEQPTEDQQWASVQVCLTNTAQAHTLCPSLEQWQNDQQVKTWSASQDCLVHPLAGLQLLVLCSERDLMKLWCCF